MSDKIYKQTDKQIVLQDTGGAVDCVFGAVLAAIGAGIIYLGWFGYQDTGKIFMPLIVVLVGSCLFFPVFKRNRLTIDTIRKEAVKTKPIKERLKGKGKVVSKCYYIIHRANTSIVAPVLRKE